VGNLFFQGSFVVQPFGTNGPLWSLAFEFWFYMLYPAVLWLTTRFGPASLLVVPALSAIISIGVLPGDQPAPGGGLERTPGGWWIAETFVYWIVWTTGAAIAEVYVGRFRVRAFWFVGSIALVVIARALTPPASPTWIGGWMLNDLLWSAIFAIVLAFALVARPIRLSQRLHGIACRAGDISYSLYLVHIPVIAFVSACWLAAGMSIPTGLELAIPVAVLAFCAAIVMWNVAERPFQRPREERHTIGANTPSELIARGTKGSFSA
jgi:peptidoglycan/LPS O-acetylase OafA/YrhL